MLKHCGVAKLARRLIVNHVTAGSNPAPTASGTGFSQCASRRLKSAPLSGSRLDGKPPALGAGESEFDSRDPDLIFEYGDVV